MSDQDKKIEQPYVVVKNNGVGEIRMSDVPPRGPKVIGPFRTMNGAKMCRAYHRAGWGVDSYEKYAELHPNDCHLSDKPEVPLYG